MFKYWYLKFLIQFFITNDLYIINISISISDFLFFRRDRIVSCFISDDIKHHLRAKFYTPSIYIIDCYIVT